MSIRPRFIYEIHHGLKVTIGHGGPAGVLLRCEGRGGDYWKVKFETGRWVWPDAIVVDSSGVYTELCAECHLEFKTNTMNELLCPECDRRTARAVGTTVSDGREYKRPLRWRASDRARSHKRL